MEFARSVCAQESPPRQKIVDRARATIPSVIIVDNHSHLAQRVIIVETGPRRLVPVRVQSKQQCPLSTRTPAMFLQPPTMTSPLRAGDSAIAVRASTLPPRSCRDSSDCRCHSAMRAHIPVNQLASEAFEKLSQSTSSTSRPSISAITAIISATPDAAFDDRPRRWSCTVSANCRLMT